MKKKKGKRRWFSYFIQLMIFTLIVSSIPLHADAESSPPFTPSPNSEPTPQPEENILPAPHPDQIKNKKEKSQPKPTEVVEERTETEKV
ncbi:hypothetical protein, partial [Bacillus mycoides]